MAVASISTSVREHAQARTGGAAGCSLLFLLLLLLFVHPRCFFVSSSFLLSYLLLDAHESISELLA